MMMRREEKKKEKRQDEKREKKCFKTIIDENDEQVFCCCASFLTGSLFGLMICEWAPFGAFGSPRPHSLHHFIVTRAKLSLMESFRSFSFCRKTPEGFCIYIQIISSEKELGENLS